MMKRFITFTILFFGATICVQAQPKSKTKKKVKTTQTTAPAAQKEVSLTEFIRTNNSDTLYLDLDNSVILTPIGKYKNIPYELKTNNGSISKMSANFFLVSDLKEPNVTISVIDEKTKAIVVEKKFIVAKQKLPF